MKKAFFIISLFSLSLLNACSQQNIDPAADTVSKPPKTMCGGVECAESN